MLMRSKPKGLDADWVRYLLRYGGGAHVRLYRATGGRLGGRLGIPFLLPSVPILLLEHVGRKSGTTFTTPLVYLEDGADLVVVASQGGRPQDPQWYRNLVAGPDVTIRVGRERRPVRARTAAPEERARLWPRLVDLYADFDSYQSWTHRDIPVVLLSPGRCAVWIAADHP